MKEMIGMTVCSGIGAPEFSAPWIDWRYQSEIEAFPSAVLAERFPDAVNLGDMTKFQEWKLDTAVDVLCGGTPCQSFSVAGLRKGLDDPRGNLMLTYLAIARRYRPRWVVWENVPGVLSSNGGRDFGSFLGGLGELGYGFAYRVLDAQFVRTRRFPNAVPQRRRRVFVVGYLGDWRRAASVLFDGESLSGNSAPRREAGKAAPTIPSRSSGGGGLGTDFDCDGGLICANSGDAGYCLTASAQQRLDAETETLIAVAHALRGEGFDTSEDGTGRGTPIVPVAYRTAGDGAVYEEGDATAPLTTATDPNAQIVAFSAKDYGGDAMENVSPTLRAGGHAGSHANAGVMPAIAMEMRDADAYEADSSSVLSTLRKEVGEEAFQQWGLGILVSFQAPEVLRSWLHGASLRKQTEEARSKLDDSTLSRAKYSYAGRILRKVWVHGPDGRTSQGRGLAKQLAGQPGAPLSVLPHEGAQSERYMYDLREAHEGARILRQTLSEMEEVGGPICGEDKSEHTTWKVRRLTPTEAERLMGFPDGWTAITYRKKPASDGPRYKALGNSWATNCGEWVFDRIRAVEELET